MERERFRIVYGVANQIANIIQNFLDSEEVVATFDTEELTTLWLQLVAMLIQEQVSTGNTLMREMGWKPSWATSYSGIGSGFSPGDLQLFLRLTPRYQYSPGVDWLPQSRSES